MARQPDLFAQVRDEFARRGLLGRVVRLQQRGRFYSVRCDEDCFVVYRVNDRAHLPPGLPGWVVCRLSSGGCFSLDPADDSCDWPPEGPGLEAAAAWVTAVTEALDPA